MTLQTQQSTTENTPAVLTDEQRRRVADALENAQSDNTRKNYASQFQNSGPGVSRRATCRFRPSPRSWLHMP